MDMPHPRRKGQTAIEYMILLGVVVALVLIAFKTQLPRMEESANIYFNRAMLGIIGDPNPCGDGFCCLPACPFGSCGTQSDGCGGTINCGACPCTSPCGHGSIAHGNTDTCYSASSVPCGGDCLSVMQTATCNNGSWSPGTFTSATAPGCSVAACASCPNVCGTTLAHNASKTCYQSSSVPCGNSCVSEIRTCNNGTASGSYTNATCSIAACCGDGACNGTETCSTCPGDCGVCPPTWHWVFQGISDCGGSDIAYVGGSSNPDPARCSGPGSVICWDNAYPNEGNPPFVEWCAYKSAVPCTGGSNLGYYYICVFG